MPVASEKILKIVSSNMQKQRNIAGENFWNMVLFKSRREHFLYESPTPLEK